MEVKEEAWNAVHAPPKTMELWTERGITPSDEVTKLRGWEGCELL